MYVDKKKDNAEIVPTPHQLENIGGMSNASLVSGISNLTEKEEQLEREREKIMQQLSEQMSKKMRVSEKKVKQKKQPRVADISQNIRSEFDPDATIDQVEEV